MRAAERKMPSNKKESTDAYKARLRKTALGLPKIVVEKAVKDMHRRVQLLMKTKGDLFTE